jgi:hypothetical protein
MLHDVAIKNRKKLTALPAFGTMKKIRNPGKKYNIISITSPKTLPSRGWWSVKMPIPHRSGAINPAIVAAYVVFKSAGVKSTIM